MDGNPGALQCAVHIDSPPLNWESLNHLQSKLASGWIQAVAHPSAMGLLALFPFSIPPMYSHDLSTYPKEQGTCVQGQQFHHSRPSILAQSVSDLRYVFTHTGRGTYSP